MDTKTPIIFNSLKHHLQSIQDFLRETINDYNENNFTQALLSLGESQMDFYYGKLNTSEIFKEINQILLENNLTNYSSYNNWLKNQNHFVPITLSDGSCWILRSGIDKTRYIHIHPGRYSLHTFRVKAATLKTAIATIVFSNMNKMGIDILLINKVREELLKLPPIKNTLNSGGIERIIHLLMNDNRPGWFNSK